MSTKNFKIKEEDFKDLVPLSIGICIASDKITVEGMDVGYMFRVKDENFKAVGWHFFLALKPKSLQTQPRILIFTT